MKKQLGFTYLSNKPKLEDVLKFDFKPGSSLGRFVSQMVKHIIDLEKSPKTAKKVYLIENPGSLTFSSSISFLLEKYRGKFNAGGRAHGPFYIKSEVGLFKLIVRTMMKYKAKHKLAYKKICVMDQFKLPQVECKFIETKDTSLSRTTSLSKLISLL